MMRGIRTLLAASWVLLAGGSVQARQSQSVEGFWVSLAAGVSGSSSISDYNEFWFDSPHAPSLVVTSVTGASTVEAATGAGTTYFSPLGTPVLLPTTDGYASLSSLNSPISATALPRFAGGALASGPPQAGGTIRSDADMLSLSLASPAANGSQLLSASVTSPSGQLLGETNVSVPGGGWWLISAGPGVSSGSSLTPPDGGGTSPVASTGEGPGSIASPEPACALLLAVAGCTSAAFRRLKGW